MARARKRHSDSDDGSMADAVDSDIYTVEELRDYRKRNGEEQFLIKWQGFGEEECTWEPRCHLPDTLQPQIDKCIQAKMATLVARNQKRSRMVLSSDEATGSDSAASNPAKISRCADAVTSKGSGDLCIAEGEASPKRSTLFDLEQADPATKVGDHQGGQMSAVRQLSKAIVGGNSEAESDVENSPETQSNTEANRNPLPEGICQTVHLKRLTLTEVSLSSIDAATDVQSIALIPASDVPSTPAMGAQSPLSKPNEDTEKMGNAAVTSTKSSLAHVSAAVESPPVAVDASLQTRESNVQLEQKSGDQVRIAAQAPADHEIMDIDSSAPSSDAEGPPEDPPVTSNSAIEVIQVAKETPSVEEGGVGKRPRGRPKAAAKSRAINEKAPTGRIKTPAVKATARKRVSRSGGKDEDSTTSTTATGGPEVLYNLPAVPPPAPPARRPSLVSAPHPQIRMTPTGVLPPEYSQHQALAAHLSPYLPGTPFPTPGWPLRTQATPSGVYHIPIHTQEYRVEHVGVPPLKGSEGLWVLLRSQEGSERYIPMHEARRDFPRELCDYFIPRIRLPPQLS